MLSPRDLRRIWKAYQKGGDLQSIFIDPPSEKSVLLTIEDPEFHKLREAYVAAHKALTEYCGLDD